MRHWPCAATVFLLLGLGACATPGAVRQPAETQPESTTGTPAGPATGDGGEQVARLTTGLLAGGALAPGLDKTLDPADRLAMRDTTQKALGTGRSGVAVAWRNAASGHSGSVTPQPPFRTDKGLDCREFQQTVTIDGAMITGYGTACRDNEGAWRMVDADAG